MIKKITSDESEIRIVNEYVALVETKPGVVLDTPKTKKLYALIEEQFSGDYSLIINRVNKYRLMRVEVYNEANKHDKLRGIAIVTNKTTELKMAEMEAPLCQKPFSTFNNVDDAVAWVQGLHQK